MKKLSLSILTKNFEPNTKLTKKQLSDLEERLEDSGPDREITLEVAITLRDNTLIPLTENELDRMIYMLKEKKGSVREIQSIVMRAIMMAIPTLNGGKRIKRKKTNKKRINNLKYTKKNALRL